MQENDDTAFTLVTVASGARSLRALVNGETFHPVVGPMAEARGLHVAQSRLAERARSCGRRFVVWDVGLGAAANAIAVLEAFAGLDLTDGVLLRSFDCTTAPLEFALRNAGALGYFTEWEPAAVQLLAEGVAQAGCVEWTLSCCDFQRFIQAPDGERPDAILYDPYSPDTNPGMWTLEHFTRLRECLGSERPCTLTSYSRSTAVRVTLALAGFHVGRGGATGEKDQTTVAATQVELLTAPLGEEWLRRVRRSTRGRPLRTGGEPGPISVADLSELERMFEFAGA